MPLERSEVRSRAQDHPHLQADPTYSRLVMRRISPSVTYAITRWTSLSADAITALAILLGIASGALVVVGGPVGFAGAAIALQLSYLCDTVDGEVARVRGTAGKRGTYLDLIGHSVQNNALYAGCSFVLLAVTGYPAWALAIVFAGLAFSSPFGELARAQVAGTPAVPLAHRPRVAEPRPAADRPLAVLYWIYRRLAFLWEYPASMNLFCLALLADAGVLAGGASTVPIVLPIFTAGFLGTLALKQLVNAVRLLDRRLWTPN